MKQTKKTALYFRVVSRFPLSTSLYLLNEKSQLFKVDKVERIRAILD